MYLKSLKVAGFKSFADRTRLEFRPGVTVVVGPNGSGKSNLVDAVSWVLGTQSTKALRTQKMEEVIFAGTATRPALNRADVTVVLDNVERSIDLDLDEVSITRRLYRDGSSDYELNGVACRLLDIQDLLSDSGVGRSQHVIISQGEIDAVLNASPEEQRAIIEDAAGILKHRRRKERAERRLERTDEDLVRLRDLVGEIQRQMRPMRRRAKAAERYEGLKSEATALRLYLGGQALAAYDRDITIASSERSQLLESVEVDEHAVAELVERLSVLTEARGRVGSRLDETTSAAALLETTRERLRRIASVAHERSRAVSGRREAVSERRADLEEESRAIAEELHAVGEERLRLQAEAETAEVRFRRLEDEAQALADQTALSPEGAMAAVRGELSALGSSMSRDQRELDGLAHRLEVLVSQREAELDEVDRLNEEIETVDAQISALQATYEKASARRRKDQDAWTGAERALSKAQLDLASAESRIEAVQAALTGSSDPAARRLAEQAPGAVGSIIALLDVPQDLRAAVYAALGRWADAVAFEDVDSLRRAVETFKTSGTAGLSVVSAMSDVTAPAREVATALGLDALIDLLGPDAHRGLAGRFLGDVVVVEGWAAGWDLISRHPALRAVTPEGDLISVAGVHIADPDGAGSSLLRNAEAALEQAGIEMARANSIHDTAHRDFERSRQAERVALERLESAEAGLAGRSEAMARLRQSVRSIEEEQARLEQRKSALTESIELSLRQRSALESRLAALEGEEAARMQAWKELETERVRLASEREGARSAWQEAAGRLRGTVERERLLSERAARIAEDLGSLDRGAMPDGDPARLEKVAQLAQRAVSVIEYGIAELRERGAGLREEKTEVGTELEQARNEEESRRASISAAKERLARLDVDLTELRLRRESAVEAIRRDADAEPETALGAPRPDLPEDADLEELLESKLAELRRLGPINPLAAEEYRELEERHRFLSEQMADVESSRAELRKVIEALETEIEQRFTSAFDEVAMAYERYFGVLFPGGRGRLRLAEPEDPRSGVIIEARPLGKRVSQLSLLSGGERSLAALAFLFAVFDARPSPFYLLDEVEAALDDANLHRFLRIVDEFRMKAQLLIVTHQQQTMEAADILYGVTMEPGGSSKAICKDMTAVASVEVA